MHPLNAHRRVLAAALMGTAVEFYDFFIYATAAALVFGPLFFPAESPAAQTLLAFVSFGIAFFARPLGAIVFGHFGDRVGRKSTLVASLLLMGTSTLAIAFLPTYAQAEAAWGAGWIAPALLCLMRFGQGLGLGGEWGGAALLAVEHAPEGWETRFVSIMQLGSPIGFLAANGVFLLLGLWLDDAAFLDWGWRIPFLASAVLVVIGLWVRLKIEETPQFREALTQRPPVRVPFASVLREHGGAVIAGSAGVVATFAIFYMATAFALAEAAGPLGYGREQFLGVQLNANLFYAGGIILAGVVADRITPAATLARAAWAAVAIGLLFGAALGSGSLLVVGAMLCATMLVLGFTNGPLGSWLSTLFPVGLRYSGVALAFNMGGIFGGALTPIAAQMLSTAGASAYTGLLITLAGLVTLAGVRFSRPVDERGQRNIERRAAKLA